MLGSESPLVGLRSQRRRGPQDRPFGERPSHTQMGAAREGGGVLCPGCEPHQTLGGTLWVGPGGEAPSALGAESPGPWPQAQEGPAPGCWAGPVPGVGRATWAERAAAPTLHGGHWSQRQLLSPCVLITADRPLEGNYHQYEISSSGEMEKGKCLPARCPVMSWGRNGEAAAPFMDLRPSLRLRPRSLVPRESLGGGVRLGGAQASPLSASSEATKAQRGRERTPRTVVRGLSRPRGPQNPLSADLWGVACRQSQDPAPTGLAQGRAAALAQGSPCGCGAEDGRWGWWGWLAPGPGAG